MIRLRQVALVARDLDAVVCASVPDAVVGELCEHLGLTVCFHDPGVAAFGLRNALMVIGDQFLEVVSPTQPGTTAGRLLDKRNGDGGYMAIYEVDDLDRREAQLAANGVRVVWRGDFDDIRGRHLHPADVGGAIVSLDQPVPNGAWRWGGPAWQGSADPTAMCERWRQCELAHGARFQPATDRGEGIDEIELVASDRSRAGETLRLCGVRITLV